MEGNEGNEGISISTAFTGTNQDLEKEYLRLTGVSFILFTILLIYFNFICLKQPPEPAMIRPLNVLKMSLEYVLDKYNKTNDYRYICDQLKAIRQDLTVRINDTLNYITNFNLLKLFNFIGSDDSK